jgi:hypothetical protein
LVWHLGIENNSATGADLTNSLEPIAIEPISAIARS